MIFRPVEGTVILNKMGCFVLLSKNVKNIFETSFLLSQRVKVGQNYS